MYQEENSTFFHEGHEYDLNTIFRLTNNFAVHLLSVSELEWILPEKVDDWNRVFASDTSVPILVMKWKKKWLVVDGLHHLIKEKLAGKTELPVKVINETILNKSFIR